MVERLWLFILCFASINCKCFNQLLKGEIYANMNKLSSNLTAFRTNLLFNNLMDSWPACFHQSLFVNKFVPSDTIKVKTTASLTLLNVLHCQIIVLATKRCWLSIRTGGNPRLSTTLTQRVMSPLLGEGRLHGYITMVMVLLCRSIYSPIIICNNN